MENPTFTALAELGILSRGADAPGQGDKADPGPHAYRDHTQFCRFENHNYRRPFPDKSIAVFDFFEPGLTVAEALAVTGLTVFLGAADSPELRACLDDPAALVLLFEPDEAALAKFLEAVPATRLARQNAFLFLGDPCSFAPALQDQLPSGVFERGTPAFFQTGRIAAEYESWAAAVTEYLEILHFRHAVYPLTGQLMKLSRPIRSIKRKLTWDQQVHAYENIPDYLSRPGIRQLRNRLKGHAAILVAAGPALTEKLDYIRANRDRAVVICVNNALKPLAEAGIRPHFTVINDTSLSSGEVFRHIPEQPGTILVGHCLSDLGRDRFRVKYLFGEHLPNIFPPREDLDLHGSVITTAFSLARHLGCARCVIAGGQLASPDPWKLAYAKGATNHAPESRRRALINQHPQLYPVDTPFGQTLYTTPNFRDAALWLAEEIRLSGIECVNTSRESILYGPGIRFESEPVLPEASFSRALADLFKPEPPSSRPDLALEHVRHERASWTAILRAAEEVLRDRTPAILIKGAAILEQLDGSGVTFLVERHPGFDNRHFHRLVFEGGPAAQAEGYRQYFEHLEQMGREVLALLDESEQACRRFR
ncbi:DUF115 domain-containing protein [Pseudodesulfovibrio cashew]|uniref:DUF115 domain-containing protein n=1 Tax=Pseudodesulfovibrio cashew TaxID=2678688 RepID=A0A6I6JFN0_9BACT|nr:6-hydroxymethylpterin diphosphokinase MptE-like protein [Pseudodesulfovibrio cashew]QGY39323.1 DUF115 domain-containing protein [Pseudodesulfovibrio cashew]